MSMPSKFPVPARGLRGWRQLLQAFNDLVDEVKKRTPVRTINEEVDFTNTGTARRTKATGESGDSSTPRWG